MFTREEQTRELARLMIENEDLKKAIQNMRDYLKYEANPPSLRMVYALEEAEKIITATTSN